MFLFKFVLLSSVFFLFTSCKSIEEKQLVYDENTSVYDIGSRNPSSSPFPDKFCQYNLSDPLERIDKYWFYVERKNLDCVTKHIELTQIQGDSLAHAQDKYGMTTIMHAAKNGDFEMICTVFAWDEDKKAYINKRDINGMTALHHAVHGRAGIDRVIAQILLIDGGIDHKILDDSRTTAYGIAEFEDLKYASMEPLPNEDLLQKMRRKLEKGFTGLNTIKKHRYAYNQVMNTITNFEQGCFTNDGTRCTRTVAEVGSICQNLYIDRKTHGGSI